MRGHGEALSEAGPYAAAGSPDERLRNPGPAPDGEEAMTGAPDDRQARLERIAALVMNAWPIERPVIPARESAPKESTSGPSGAGPIEPSLPSSDPPAAAGAAGHAHPSDPPDLSSPPAAVVELSLENKPSQMGEPARKSDGRKGAGRRETQRRNSAGNGDGPPDDEERLAALDRRLAFFPMTDLGNAERFRERQRGLLIWCFAIGWLWWDGKRWAREGADERVSIAAHMSMRSIQDEADAIAGTDLDRLVGHKGRKGEEEEIYLSDMLRGFGRDSESNAKLNLVAKQASAYLAVQPVALDANPFAINMRNGTLIVDRKVEGYITFKPHDPADLMTKIAPVDYLPGSPRPRFDQFIAEVQPDAATRRTLQQWKGYSLTGDVSEQKLAAFHGKGRNGKSVFEEITAFVAGDYCATTPIETFLAEGRGRNAGQATPDLAVLPGVRMLRTSEPKKGAQLDEGLIKLATGGEPIKARHLNRDYFDFYPSFKLTISGNYRPKIVGADEGIWRRIVLVPWPVTIAKEKQDRHLATKLRDEASGILDWMLDGLRDWLDNGLMLGEEVETATAEYRHDSDQLGRFLEQCTVPSLGDRVQSTVLHSVFNAWSLANSLNEWKGRGFSDAMAERGFKRTKSSVVFFLDLKLTKTVADFLDYEGKPLRGGVKTEVPGPGYGNDEITF